MNDLFVLPLSNRKDIICIIDADESPRVLAYNWYYCKRCHEVRSKINYETVRLSRFLLNYTGPLLVDHRNRNPMINIKGNLRLASDHLNNHNRTKDLTTTSKYRGVCWDKSTHKWKAQMKHRRRNYYLGSFHEEVEAALAYNKKAAEIFGSDAYLNSVKEVSNAQ